MRIPRTTVIEAVGSDAPPRYERVGWPESIRWFTENVARLRPEHRPVDPADWLT